MTTTCDPTSTFDLAGLLGPLDPVGTAEPADETDDRRLSDERAALFTTGGIQDEDDRLGSEDFYELMIDPHASAGNPQQQNQPMMMPPMAMGGRGADAGAGAAGAGRPPIGVGIAPSGAGAVGAAGAVPGAGMGAPGSVGANPGAAGAVGLGSTGSGGLGSSGVGGLGSSGVGVATPTGGFLGTTAAGVDSGRDRIDTGSYGSRAYDPNAVPNRVSDTGQAADTSTQPYVARHAYEEGSPVDLTSVPASNSGSNFASDPGLTAGAGASSGDIPGADLPAAGMPSGGVPSGGVPSGGVPSGGVPSAGVPSGGVPSAGVPAGGAPVGGSRTGETESSNAWSLDDLTAEAKLWDEAAKAHQTSVVADHILTQQDASGGLLNQVSRSIRSHVSELERLSHEAAKVMQGISGTLEHTVTTKAEAEAANTDAARSGTQGDPR